MHILVIEDNRAVGAHIVEGLRREGYGVESVDTGADALRCLRLSPYDLVVCDVVLPDVNGFELIKGIRQLDEHIPVLFLSALDKVSDRVDGLQAGGDDYLTKPFAFSELLARVRALLRRRNTVVVPDDALQVGDLRLDLVRRKVYRGETEIVLQPLEFKLLQYMMRNAGRALSKTLIMEQMWDLHFDPGSNVVEVRMHHLRNKIDKHFPTKLIHTVRGVGYMLEEREERALA